MPLEALRGFLGWYDKKYFRMASSIAKRVRVSSVLTASTGTSSGICGDWRRGTTTPRLGRTRTNQRKASMCTRILFMRYFTQLIFATFGEGVASTSLMAISAVLSDAKSSRNTACW